MATAKKPCPITEMGITRIDYKDVELLKKFITKFNRITPRYYSGVSLKHQKALARAIKVARYMGLLPYVLDLKRKPVSVETPLAAQAAAAA